MVLKNFLVCFKTLFRKIPKILAYIRLFLANLVVRKDIKSKRKLCRHSFFNILRHFDVLPNYPFVTSEKMS